MMDILDVKGRLPIGVSLNVLVLVVDAASSAIDETNNGDYD